MPFNGFYWAFITAMTIGYGDIRPTSQLSQALSIFIGFAGMVFSGILVALAVHSAALLSQLITQQSSGSRESRHGGICLRNQA